MTRTVRHRAVALVLGVTTGGGLWWTDAALGLSVVAGVSILVLVLVGARAVREYPAYTSADRSWRDNQWIAVGQVFVFVVAFQAISLLPVTLPDRVALFVVVAATFMIGYFAGGMDALRRDRRTDDQQDAATSADD